MIKKFLVLMTSLALGLLGASSVLAFTGSFVPGSGINGTVHDMTIQGNYGPATADASGGRICIYCHTPHNSIAPSPENNNGQTIAGGNQTTDPRFTYMPLWNHALTTILNYNTYYNGPGAPQVGSHASQSIANGMAPGSVSLLCLSCHDGSVAVNTYGNSAYQPAGSTSVGSATIAAQYQIGANGNLQNHHPIGFDYDAVQMADAEIRPDTTLLSAGSGIDGSISAHLYGGSATGACGQNCMECGTCHSVHNKGNTGERLLWRSDINSQLCLSCHDKGTYTPPDAAENAGIPMP
jgi:hypothetical protein